MLQHFLLKNPRLFPCLVLFALELLFLQREFFSLKEKEHDEGGSTIMFLQLFSAQCWTPAKILEYHFRAVCQEFMRLLSPPSTNFLLIGFFPLPQHTFIAPAPCQDQKKQMRIKNGLCLLGPPSLIKKTKKRSNKYIALCQYVPSNREM